MILVDDIVKTLLNPFTAAVSIGFVTDSCLLSAVKASDVLLLAAVAWRPAIITTITNKLNLKHRCQIGIRRRQGDSVE